MPSLLSISQRNPQSPAPNAPPIFISMGPLVLDQVQFANGATRNDVPGGTGLYATVGARIVAGKNQSSSIGCVVISGFDFPEHVIRQIQGWGMRLLIRQESGKPSTRGCLQYHDEYFGSKTFTFLTPPLFTKISHLRGSSLLGSSTFHFLEVPDTLNHQINDLRSTRAAAGIREVPKLVWEPKPSACRNAGLEAHLRACKLVNVFSPNHIELVALVGGESTEPFSRITIERCADRFLASGIGPTKAGFVVVRCGEHGSMAGSRQGLCQWYPPYHTSASRVVDATGAGNSFLGGFTVGMMKSGGDIKEGIVYGTVAASLVIEQFGFPTCRASGDMERWNGVDVVARMQEYRERLHTLS